MLAALSRALFTNLANVPALARLASRFGMRTPDGFARRFVAGETLPEAMEVARTLERTGFRITLDLLGEHVRSTEGAQAATRAYLDAMDEIAGAGIGRNLSIKLTQIGLDVDRATALDNLRRILDVADRHEFFVRVDMEHSRYVDATLQIIDAVWSIEQRRVGVVLQAALRRTEQDLGRMNELGVPVRLVKGAYRETAEVAVQTDEEIAEAFQALLPTLLTDGTAPAVATHDPVLIEATRTIAARESLPADRFEFQMLYGVRRDLQAALLREGYRFRVYVPFGRDWFPYVMRRLGERPANVRFVLRALFRDKAQ